MDLTFSYQGQLFVWSSEKAASNLAKHGVALEKACEVFFDPFVRLADASPKGETRLAAIGMAEDWPILYVVISHGKTRQYESSLPDPRQPAKEKPMKTMTDRLRNRLTTDRPMTSISLRIPEDVIEDLKEVAPSLGFSGYQPLIRVYIGQGLRRDLARLEKERSEVEALTQSLRNRGVDEKTITAAMREAKRKSA